MRFTSLVIELIRARPRLIVWIVVLLQAAMWLFVALVFYRSPPGSLATLLAFGREYQVGTDLGPPLPVWLADIAYRAAGGHVFGVYVLAELCEDRDLHHALSSVPRGGRPSAGGARRAADHDAAGLLLARTRLRPAGAGAAALGAAAAAFLADHRPAPRQCLVRLVDRSGPLAADDAGGDLPAAADRRLRALDRGRPPHVARARSAVRAGRRRRAGIALCRLADARRDACPAGLA